MPTRPLICRLAALSTFCAACVLAQLCPTLWTLWTIAHQAPVSMEFSRQEYWNGLPFPTPGDIPNPGMEPRFPTLQADSLPSEPLLSRFSRVRLCVTPETAAHQALPSLGFSRQEHWSGLPFPSPMHESEQ